MTARAAAACACFVLMCLDGQAQSNATTAIGGRLTFSGSGKPLAGATLRFVPEDPERPPIEAVTDERGDFAVEGLGLGTYTVEIENAEGKVVRAVEARAIDESAGSSSSSRGRSASEARRPSRSGQTCSPRRWSASA